MSDAKMKHPDQRREKYLEQNRFGALTIPQRRQLRKSEGRYTHQEQHAKLKEKQRTRRARFRDWMAGMR
jgi:hypothetical protein